MKTFEIDPQRIWNVWRPHSLIKVHRFFLQRNNDMHTMGYWKRCRVTNSSESADTKKLNSIFLEADLTWQTDLIAIRSLRINNGILWKDRFIFLIPIPFLHRRFWILKYVRKLECLTYELIIFGVDEAIVHLFRVHSLEVYNTETILCSENQKLSSRKLVIYSKQQYHILKWESWVTVSKSGFVPDTGDRTLGAYDLTRGRKWHFSRELSLSRSRGEVKSTTKCSSVYFSRCSVLSNIVTNTCFVSNRDTSPSSRSERSATCGTCGLETCLHLP
jgi:hypothetical protein